VYDEIGESAEKDGVTGLVIVVV